MKHIYFLLLVALSSLGFSAHAQNIANFPDHPVKLIIPYGPGGAVDITARILAQDLSKLWGQQALVDNKPGAAGMIAANAVAKAAPDGYTLLITDDGVLISMPQFQKNMPYNTFTDLMPIGMVCMFPYLIVANPQSKIKNLSELVSVAKANPNSIDYATNGMRTDFMDIYLGAKCTFVITVGTGFDAVPVIFRRPMVQVNAVPLGICYTWGNSPLLLTKHHIDIVSGDELTLSQIFLRDVGFCTNTSDYESKGVKLIENTPEEIRDVVIEMAERLAGTFKSHQVDDTLQKRFWEIFPVNKLDVNGVPTHGKIQSRYSTVYLRKNPEWLS